MSVTRARPMVPEELPRLLHDLSYAVIKNNPRDIISFAADYFQQLQDERVKRMSGGVEDAIWKKEVVTEISNVKNECVFEDNESSVKSVVNENSSGVEENEQEVEEESKQDLAE